MRMMSGGTGLLGVLCHGWGLVKLGRVQPRTQWLFARSPGSPGPASGC